MRAAKVQASLRIRAVSPEPSLLAHISNESRGTFRQKARSLAPLNGWACAVEICHDGMLEDTNSLDGAHMCTIEYINMDLRLICFVSVLCFRTPVVSTTNCFKEAVPMFLSLYGFVILFTVWPFCIIMSFSVVSVVSCYCVVLLIANRFSQYLIIAKHAFPVVVFLHPCYNPTPPLTHIHTLTPPPTHIHTLIRNDTITLKVAFYLCMCLIIYLRYEEIQARMQGA